MKSMYELIRGLRGYQLTRGGSVVDERELRLFTADLIEILTEIEEKIYPQGGC